LVSVVAASRRAIRKAQIVDGAIALFSEHGYSSVTVQDIADSLGISVGLIYRYASSKQELLKMSLQLLMESYEQSLNASAQLYDDPLEALHGAFYGYCRAIDKRRRHLVMTYTEVSQLDRDGVTQMKANERSLHSIFTRLVARVVDAHGLSADSVELTAMNLRYSAHGWALKYWYFGEQGFVWDRYVALEFRMIMRGLGVDPKDLERFMVA
jgi:AcrR family transcriptional regulator